MKTNIKSPFKSNMKNMLILLTALTLTPILSGCVGLLFAGAAGTTAMIASDRRTLGAQVEDKEISRKVQAWIKADPELKDAVRIEVVSFNRHILLIGQAPSNHLRDKVMNIASEYPNFTDLYNEIKIEEKLTTGQSAKDALISTKIKTRMLADKELNPNHISINTEKGVVYLMGMLTPKEQKIAITIARNINDVVKVVDIFQPYTIPEPKVAQ